MAIPDAHLLWSDPQTITLQTVTKTYPPSVVMFEFSVQLLTYKPGIQLCLVTEKLAKAGIKYDY